MHMATCLIKHFGSQRVTLGVVRPSWLTLEAGNGMKRIGEKSGVPLVANQGQLQQDTLSEWLRRWTRNPLGSARKGSNPLGVEDDVRRLLRNWIILIPRTTTINNPPLCPTFVGLLFYVRPAMP